MGLVLEVNPFTTESEGTFFKNHPWNRNGIHHLTAVKALVFLRYLDNLAFVASRPGIAIELDSVLKVPVRS